MGFEFHNSKFCVFLHVVVAYTYSEFTEDFSWIIQNSKMGYARKYKNLINYWNSTDVFYFPYRYFQFLTMKDKRKSV